MTAVLEKVTQPGRYELTEADYHRDPVEGGSLSSSGARALMTRTPAHFAYQREHGRPDSSVFDLGHAAHAQVLGVGAPIAEIDADDWRSKTAKEEAAAARAEGATPLLVKDARRVAAMVTAVREHPVAGPLFARPGHAEQSFVARDPESGVMCRIRPDWMPDVDDSARLIVVDLKTTTDADPHSFAASMARWAYHQQDTFYIDALHWLDLTGGLEPLFVFVAVEKDPPHLVSVDRPSERAREWGRVLNRKARDLFRGCTDTGVWPGYAPIVHDLDLPGWQERAYEAADAAGRFDTWSDWSDLMEDPE